MKHSNKIFFGASVIIGMFLIFIFSCKKEDSNVHSNAITDADGNIYHSVTIGTQVWMVENLKTTRFNDGTAIPNIPVDAAWGTLSSPSYCWYNNDAASYKDTYGALYNEYAVGSGKLCPAGWHVPTDAEWSTLENYLVNNGYNYDGSTDGDRLTNNKIAKALAASTNWKTANGTGNVGNIDYSAKRNVTGFSALPGGLRDYDGSFKWIGSIGYWWNSSEYNTSDAWSRLMNFSISNVYSFYGGKGAGFSVRCVKD